MIRRITEELRRHIYSAKDFDTPKTDNPLAGTYDVCVIGSGPGGSVAAATLAQAGLKVLLIERGPFLPAELFNFRALDMSNRMGHLELTSGYRTVLYQGNALGGGSLLYGAVAMKPPSFVFDEWEKHSGVSSINRASLEPHYRHVADVMSVTRQTRKLENRSNAVVREMASALGKPEGLELVERYTQGCAGAGLCSFGCGFDLKGNMINSFLPMLRPPRIETEADLKKIERLDFGDDDLILYSDHTCGGNPYGIDRRHGVTDEWGRVFDTENVYVADSSLFPSASGINPSWTIMALSHRTASKLVDSKKA